MKLLNKEKKRALLIRYFPFIISQIQKLIFKTIKWEVIGLENGRNVSTPVIISFFHARMLMLPFFYSSLRPQRKIKMIVSSHFDGDFIGKIVSYYGIETLKGSSTRGGVKLLKEIHRIKDFDIGITPDGPRGPKENVKSGVIYISKVTGFPILPITYSVKNSKILNSWDNFILPKPFSKGVFICGEPLNVPHNIDNEDIPKWCEKLEIIMKELNKIADSFTQRA